MSDIFFSIIVSPSNTSIFSGKVTLGLLIFFKLPLPLSLRVKIAGIPSSIFSSEIEEVKLNDPTAPEKFSGIFFNEETFTVKGSDTKILALVYCEKVSKKGSFQNNLLKDGSFSFVSTFIIIESSSNTPSSKGNIDTS